MTGEANSEAVSTGIKRSNIHEGPRNHILVFALSIILTLLAFMAILYQHLIAPWFLYGFIMALATLQAIIQAIFWMHLKDREHLHQRIYIIGGAYVATLAIISGLFWVWLG